MAKVGGNCEIVPDSISSSGFSVQCQIPDDARPKRSYRSPLHHISTHLVFANNFLLVLIGAGLITLGSYSYLHADNFVLVEYLGFGVVGLGIGICVLSVIGMIDSFKKSTGLGIFYFMTLYTFSIGEILIVFLAFILRNYAYQFFSTMWAQFTISEKNAVQFEFNCVGFSNSTDSPGSYQGSADGCYQTVYDDISYYFVVIISCALVVFVFQCYLLLTTALLIRFKIKDKGAKKIDQIETLQAIRRYSTPKI